MDRKTLKLAKALATVDKREYAEILETVDLLHALGIRAPKKARKPKKKAVAKSEPAPAKAAKKEKAPKKEAAAANVPA